MKQLKYFSLIALLITLLVSCGDDDDDNPTNTDLVSKTWRVSRVLINGTEDVSTDYSAYRFTFTSNGTFNFTDPTSRSGSWAFNSTETTIVVDGETYTIITLTETSFIFERTIPENFKDDAMTARFELVL